MNYTKHITLNTDRLQLREMNLSDMDALSLILQDEKVMYAYNGAFNDEETIAWMQKQLRRYKEYGFGLWGVVNKKVRRNDRSMRHYHAGIQRTTSS